MQEAFASVGQNEMPRTDQVFYELHLFACPSLSPRHYVLQARIRWDDEKQAFFFDREEVERFDSYQEAIACYELRRIGLMNCGFTISDKKCIIGD